MVTTSPVTMRVNIKVLALARAQAKKSNRFYQSVLNEALAKSFGVKLPVMPNTKLAAKGKAKPKHKLAKGEKYVSKGQLAKLQAAKKAAKVLKRPKTKFKLKKK
jgi:hypothetical protein